MPGMNRHTGRRIEGTAQIEQSIEVLLTTRLTERPFMNDLGAENITLQDAAVNQFFLVDLYMGVLDPIRKWIEKVEVKGAQLADTNDQGRSWVEIEIVERATGRPLRLQPIAITAAGFEARVPEEQPK